MSTGYFGPYTIHGEVQKRVRGKAYGVNFTCMISRAVYVDLAHDLSTDGFLQLFRRYVSIRGWPSKIYSDNGTQLVGASKELKRIVKGLGWNKIQDKSISMEQSGVFPQRMHRGTMVLQKHSSN